MVSSKTLPENLNLIFRSKFSLSFTNHGCLHCAILKAICGFQEKRDREARDSLFFFQNFQNDIFEILKIFSDKSNSPEHAVELTKNVSTETKSALMIFLCCDYCCWLLCCNYWSCLMLWNFFLKSFKVNCSNAACSSSMQLIFNK